MNNNIFKIWTVLLSIVCLVVLVVIPSTACTPKDPDTGRIIVAVTLLPQAGFVEAIAGDKVEVLVMVPPGASPHTYEVTPSQMVKLTKAEMYVKVGSPVEFELAWMDKLVEANRNMLVINSARGIELIEIDQPHEHEDEHHHDHKGLDPHIWLSVRNASVMVSNICEGLVQIDPRNKAYYEKNCGEYLEQLSNLDRDITEALSGVINRNFIVFHPAFGYFARDYNLNQIPVEKGGQEPDAAYIIRLIEEARKHDIRVVFASPQYSTRSAEVIAGEIGGRVVNINPLARDYIANMQAIATAMKHAMR